MLVDRDAVQKHHLRSRRTHHAPTSSTVPSSSSPRTRHGNSASKRRSKLLEEAGWKAGADGIREKDGKKLKLLYQTAINGPRQKTQAIVKQACQKAGIDVELKSVVASVFFSSDVANPDTYSKFYADIEMFQIPMTQPDPAQHMRRYHSRNVATKENKWQGMNFPRWVNKEYDATVDAAEAETDPVKRAALYIKANDIMWQDTVVIPVMHRLKVEACSNTLRPVVSGWANETDNYSGLVPGGDGIIAHGIFPHESVCPASPPDRGSEPARHFARAVHRAGAGARRSLQ